MRGRRPAGPEYVDQLAGSEQARQRLKVVLQTLAGQLRLKEACAQLGIGEVRFHELRQTVLTAALTALEARPAGRPRHKATPEQAQVDALTERVGALEVELQAAQVREEIALALPQVGATPPSAEKKTTQRHPARRRRRTRPNT